MSRVTGSGRVAGQRTAGASESVVEGDGCGECGEAAGQADAQLVQLAGAVAFEAEDVFGGPEDRLDPLSDRSQVRAAALLILAAGRWMVASRACRSISNCRPQKFLSPTM